jgi:hypothetical protein
MDTIQSDVPAIDGGEKYAQIFFRMKSLITDIHGMKSAAQFLGVLTDKIITRGAPTKLISDSTCVEYTMHVWHFFLAESHTSNTRTQLNGNPKQ